MSDSKVSKKRSSKHTSLVCAVILMAIMVIALVVFVSVQKPKTIVTAITLTQTAQFQQTSLSGSFTPDPLATPVVPGSVVNVNGIVFVGGFMVLLVLVAVLREALLDPEK
jgi:hypothetical protein